MTTRNRAPLRTPGAPPTELLIPACDRCGRWCPTENLQHDGLGAICPGCTRGAMAAKTTNQEARY